MSYLAGGQSIVVPSLARTRLALQGVELLAFGAVWTQTASGSWVAPDAELAEICGVAPDALAFVFDSLVSKGALVKRKAPSGKFWYQVSREAATGSRRAPGRVARCPVCGERAARVSRSSEVFMCSADSAHRFRFDGEGRPEIIPAPRYGEGGGS